MRGSASPKGSGHSLLPQPEIHQWAEPRATPENWVGRIGVPLYLAALFAAPAWLEGPAEPSSGLTVNDLRSVAGFLWWALLAAGPTVLVMLRFAPLGYFAVLALPARRRWSRRVLHVTVPAMILSTLLAGVVLYVEDGAWRIPRAFDLLSASVVCAIGVWMGGSWLRGWLARFLFIPKLACVVLLLPAAAGSLIYFTLQPEPLAIDAPQLTSDTRRRLFRTLSGRNPRNLEPGATATLVLGDADINGLLAWGASAVRDSRVAAVDLSGAAPVVRISAISPLARGGARYVNITVGGDLRVIHGVLDLDIRHLRVGPIDVPGFLLAVASPLVASVANSSRQLRPLLGPIQDLRVRSPVLSATYGRADLPPGFIASIFEGDESVKALQAAVSAHATHLLESAARSAPAGQKVGAALEAALRHARERSRGRDAASENQAAILALGIVLGHASLERVVGPVLDDAGRRTARAFDDATIRQRQDWTKHFFLSAAIGVLANQGISDAVGMFKEELDADGGTGFSFGDLLADRSGTAFAVAATRDGASARAMQDRLAQGFRVEDFLPAGADLPENLTDAQLSDRFGGVNGKEFRRVADEIDRRVASCAAYRGRASLVALR